MAYAGQAGGRNFGSWCAWPQTLELPYAYSEAGRSPGDFPDEHYESDWPNRFQPEQLNEAARSGLGYR